MPLQEKYGRIASTGCAMKSFALSFLRNTQPLITQALEAAHPQLAPLREKYGLMAGTLARSRVSQGGTPPMATGMLTLHLIGGGDGAAPVKYCKPVPGEQDLYAIGRCAEGSGPPARSSCKHRLSWSCM